MHAQWPNLLTVYDSGLLSKCCAITRLILINITRSDPFSTRVALSPPLLKNIGDYLRRLDLCDCGLEGTLPADIGTICPNLQILGLAGNPGVTGPIPSSIGKLKFLIKLFLNQNNLNGPVPPSLAALKALYKLYLFDNQLAPVKDAPLSSDGTMRYNNHAEVQSFLASLN